MKVLQINVCYGYASTGRNVQEIAEVLDSKQIENYVAYYDAINPRDKDYKIGNIADEKIHALCSRIFGLQGYFSYFSTLKLIKFIDKIKPDVIHLNNVHSNYIHFYKLLEYLGEKNIATVITLHDCFFFTGKCCHYTVDKCYKWQEKCGHCPRLKKDNKSLFFDRTSKMLKDKEKVFSNIKNLAVVGVSDWITNEAKKSILKDAKIIDRVYNWVDLQKFKPINVKKEEKYCKHFNILAVASGWNYQKGLKIIIELANILDNNEQIILVGDIKEDVLLPKNITHIPQTHNIDELVKLYNTADVFINPSLEETFGKVTAEALSCGVPCIVMNSTASPELICEGCGYVVKSNKIEDILLKIKEVKSQGKSNYSNKCREFAEINFNKQTNIDKQIEIYKKVIQ